jgi:hypothetical protein
MGLHGKMRVAEDLLQMEEVLPMAMECGWLQGMDLAPNPIFSGPWMDLHGMLLLAEDLLMVVLV